MPIVAVAILALVGSALLADGGQRMVFPLVADDDSIRVVDANLGNAADGGRVITVTLENLTTRNVSTEDVWFAFGRFFTPSEMRRNGDRIAYECGGTRRAAPPAVLLAPGNRRQVTLPLSDPRCLEVSDHEHFFVTVDRLRESASFSRTTWKRDPRQFADLLRSIQPHR